MDVLEIVITLITTTRTMYLIDQEIANEIARTQKMMYPAMQRMFLMTEEEADREEMKWREEIEEKADSTVARVVTVYLPLLLENKAITSYIHKTKHQALRRMMPEILTVEEAISLAQMDILMMDQKQAMKAKEVMKVYQNLFAKEKRKR